MSYFDVFQSLLQFLTAICCCKGRVIWSGAKVLVILVHNKNVKFIFLKTGRSGFWNTPLLVVVYTVFNLVCTKFLFAVC